LTAENIKYQPLKLIKQGLTGTKQS